MLAFDVVQAMSMLETLHIAEESPVSHTTEKLNLLNSMIDLSRQQQVCAVGALLSILQRERVCSNPAVECFMS